MERGGDATPVSPQGPASHDAWGIFSRKAICWAIAFML